VVSAARTAVKRALSLAHSSMPAEGMTILTYHRVGGPAYDELDISRESFTEQLDVLTAHRVLSIDAALDALDTVDRSPSVVLSFDDGFADVYDHAWPLLQERQLPFVLYLASAYVGGAMRWSGQTARDADALGLEWDQIREMVRSGLCTLGNHTHSHVPPQLSSVGELDRCNEMVQRHVGVRPQHFAYPWGVPVPVLSDALRTRFRSAATGRLGRNLPGTDRMLLARLPVRRSDPLSFFRAKLVGGLFTERAYGSIVSTAKRVGVHA